MNKNSYLKLLIVCLAVVLFSVSLTGTSYSFSDEPIQFGVTCTLTGNNALSGEYIQRGAILAMEHLNANGGVLGREVKLVIEDEGDNQQTAINASQKVLSNENLSGFIGGFTSSYGLAMIPFVNNAEVPFMALGTSASIAAEKSEWTWQTRLIDSYSSTALADAAAGLLKFEKPAILYVNESFGISSYESVVKELKEKYNVTPSISLAYNRGESQFSNMFTQILASDADGLIAFVTQPIDAATIMSQTKAMNFSIPKLGSSGFAMAVARQAVKGMLMAGTL